MTALAEILSARGASLSGSDSSETFYTDRILRKIGIPYKENFSAAHIEADLELVIHSAAYLREENPELLAAKEAGIPVISYPEALGFLSESVDSSGIAGTHGKTTTSAMAGMLLKYLDLPATVLAGSLVPDFGGCSSLILGNRYFIAETCEYRRHFLKFNPDRIIMTGVEPEHLDYYRDFDDILEAFEAYCSRLPQGGILIYNSDDSGSTEVAGRLEKKCADLTFIPYGCRAGGSFKINSVETGSGKTTFKLEGFPGEFCLKIPGRHSAFNAAAAIALVINLLEKEKGKIETTDLERMREGLIAFRGSKRRSEVIGEAIGIIFMDDYGHHPTEILTTLEGYKAFYPGRRLIVDFMPHTYSRTCALLEDFASCFAPADKVILHRIYSSARENKDHGISGKTLFLEVSKNHPSVRYFENPQDSLAYLEGSLKSGDIFLTMGAGDNWKLGEHLFRRFKEAER